MAYKSLLSMIQNFYRLFYYVDYTGEASVDRCG